MRWTRAAVLMLAGIAGVLLCAGGVAGVLFVRGHVGRGTERVRQAVDSLLRAAQEGVVGAGPMIAAARAGLAERLADEVFAGLRADLDRVASSLGAVARTLDAAAGLLELMDATKENRDAVARLEARAGDLLDAARGLAGFRLREEVRARAGPILDAVERILAEVRIGLARFESRVGNFRGRVDRLLDGATFLLVFVLTWMALGQVCLFRAGRRSLRPARAAAGG